MGSIRSAASWASRTVWHHAKGPRVGGPSRMSVLSLAYAILIIETLVATLSLSGTVFATTLKGTKPNAACVASNNCAGACSGTGGVGSGIVCSSGGSLCKCSAS